MKILEKNYPVKRISPKNEHFTFGYYDIQPFSKNLHLAHRFPFADRLHKKGDVADVGLFDISHSEPKFEKLDSTSAWCFQQGSMLQWNPARPADEVVYNTLIDGEYHAVVLNINNGKKRFLNRPVANISSDGKYALSINFSRLYDFRAGYGYADVRDPFYDVKHSTEDGVFLIDMETGKDRLILSMQEIWDFAGAFFKEDQKLNINHITFNPSASRFVALVRNFPKPGERHDTALVTADINGKDLFLLSDFAIQSHYHWKNDEEIIFFCEALELDCKKGWLNTYVLKDKTHEGSLVAGGYFDVDHHMSYSPDRKVFMTDTYPMENSIQTLRLYNPEKDICTNLGKFYSLPDWTGDIRCDMHPRWNETGLKISFDSTMEGFRGIYVMDLEEFQDDLFCE